VATLQLYVLGTLDMRYGDQSLPKPPTQKSQSLLAYLVLHRHQPQLRDRLVGLFWGDRPERRARRCLSTALWRIRRCLPDDGLILSDPHTVQFDPQADLWLDADVFESHARQDDTPSLSSAVTLYRGDFLDGFYDDWIINERYRLETLFLEALARLMVCYERKGDPNGALATALQLLSHDPLREDAHRLAMRAYCRLGQRNAALEQYGRCQKSIREELGVEPMAETMELYQAILEGRFEVGPVAEAVPLQIPVLEPPAPSGRSPLDVIAPVKLVGREQELAFLHECWQVATSRANRRAQAGPGELVFIRGEAGVGKTRLVEAFADRLRWEGVRVLWGRCYQFERVLPYQPIAEALRGLTPAELGDVPADALAEVARLAPGLLAGCPGLEDRAALDPEQERARLFEGLAGLLAGLAERDALLVVLEDLHWATESTLGLLHYLTRQLHSQPALLLGTYRTEAVRAGHPLLDLQRRLTREGLAWRLNLARLSLGAVAELVGEMSGSGEAVAALAERLYQETEGNPFYLMEMVKALFGMGAVHLDPEEDVWRVDFTRISRGELPLPASVSEAIQARTQRLDGDTQEALHLAAVLGREFDFEPLDTVWGRGQEATLEALDNLLRHRLIDEGSGVTGRDYAFTHHKIQEVVYAGVPRRRREHLHARVGRALERVYGPEETEALAGELAFHFQEGQELDPSLTERAINYLLQAGDQARLAYAHKEAIGYYRQALAFLKEQRAYERAARTLMKLGLTHHTAFEFRRARQAYEEGFALWQRAGEMESTVHPAAPHALRIACVDPLTLDPSLAADADSGAVIYQLFSGLVGLSPEMDVVPDVARSWEVLEDGRKYVFHLRDDVRWSDGTPVTAGDFEYAWKRVLDPATGSPNASLLYDVRGARAFHRGEAGREDVGVRAPDELTLVVGLEGPTGYFLQLLDHNACYPVPRHVVEAQGAAWIEPGNIVTNGPFRLEAWQRGDSMVLVRNPEYHGQFRGNVQRVELSTIQDPSTTSEMYETDCLDILDFFNILLQQDRDRVWRRHAGDYVSRPILSTGYLAFDASRPPFDDPRVRRAFVLATDRETLADEVTRGFFSPATGGSVPPGMTGHSAGIGLPYDPDQARHLLAEAGYPDGCGFPAVDVLLPAQGNATIEYLQAQWRENLGIEIEWQAMEMGILLDRLRVESPPIFILAWNADYPDPDAFLRVEVTNIRRINQWRNETYDRLVEEARRATDQRQRMKLYAQADQILVEEAAIVPIYYQCERLLVKPWVSNYLTAATEHVYWRDVIINPH
jgi:ABC-type oligopeptide transport system substrate-binding subunit/DNA-binding SARP family transcriptional activator